jgi:integrase
VHRSAAGDRSVWRARIETAAFAELPLAAITPKDVRDWVALQVRTPVQRKSGPAKPPARQTVSNALNLLRVALEAACEAELLTKNPARDIRVPRLARKTDPWTWLSAQEITQLTGDRVDQPYRDVFTFAIYSGLRAGEIFGLEWADVDLEAAKATIRHSWRGTPTKRGEARQLHLFGPALEALRRQQARTAKHKHVFAAADGDPHARGYDAQLADWLATSGIKRRVRFHDLRHTCASHLVSGTWGRAWTIEEVAAHLGHSTSATSRRYAHLSPEGLARAVAETCPELAQVVALPTRPREVPKPVPRSSHPALLAVGFGAGLNKKEPGKPGSFDSSHLSESNGRPTVYETVALPTELRWQPRENGPLQ